MSEETFEDYKVLKPIRHEAGWLVLPIPYWADEDKGKGSQWEKDQRALYDREEDFAREMLCDFSAQLGIVAYSSFNSRIHIQKEPIKVDPTIPLCLAMDFNLANLVGLVCQIRSNKLYVIDEIYLAPGTIDKWVQEFRNLYPAHPGGICIYGDTNGRSRNVQTGKSEYQLIELGLAGYPSNIELRVPRAHPNPKDRINSMNRKLKGYENSPGVEIYSGCTELIKDCEQVVLRPDGKDVLKIYKESNAYAARTHASDALSYLIFREWPIRKEVHDLKAKASKARSPLVYGEVLGSFN